MMIGVRTPFVLVGTAAFLAAVALPGLGQQQPEVVGLSVADLAGRLNVAPGEVTVGSVEEVTWPDGSLGHPEPGRFYTQAEVPGYRVILEAGGTQYEYHTSRTRLFVFCGAVEASGATPGTAPATTPGHGLLPVQPGPSPVSPGASGAAYVCYLRAAPNDPNGNSALVGRRISDRVETVWLDGVTTYAISPTGSILAVRRTSRSTHDLLLKPPGGQPQSLANGFAFRGLSWQGATARFSFWSRERIDAPWSLCLGDTSGTIRKLSVEVAVPIKPTAVQWGTDCGVFSVPISDTSATIYVIEAVTGNLLGPTFQGDEASLVTVPAATRAPQ